MLMLHPSWTNLYAFEGSWMALEGDCENEDRAVDPRPMAGGKAEADSVSGGMEAMAPETRTNSQS